MTTRITRSKLQSQQNQFQIDSLAINECGVFNIVEVPYDGDCLFSSILDFIEQNRAHFKDAPHSANRIRLDAVDYILSRNSIGFQENWERFVGNIKFNLEQRVAGLLDYGRNDQVNDLAKRAYRTYMSTPSTYGTFSELIATAELYGFVVHIFHRDASQNYICYEAGTTGNASIDRKKLRLFLLFTGPTDSGHFRRLDPAIVPTIVQAGNYQRIDGSSTSQNHCSKIVIKKCHMRDKPSRITEKETSIDDSLSTYNYTSEIYDLELPVDLTETMDPKVPKDQPAEAIPNVTATTAFTCDVCKQSFGTKNGLAIHRNRHANEANATTASKLCSRLTKSNKIDPKSNNAIPNGTTTESTQSIRAALDSECNTWQKTFEKYENSVDLDIKVFEEDMTKFTKFLFKANQRLPGPQHPSVKFYRLRQQKRNRKNMSAQQSRTSNPQRTDAKAKQRRRDKYQYDLAQYWYYNQRKKAVRMVMSSGSTKQCKIKMNELENHFKAIFERINDHCLEHYPTCEFNEDIFVSEEDIKIQMKKTKLDTSTGPDRILMKTLRQLTVAKSISSITNIMLSTSYVPEGFRKGRMILTDKDGDVHSITNWRPISIYSILRRIIERALDAALRAQIRINFNQRGFITGIPGCHVNAKLVNACLSHAKKRKKNCVVVFLDVSKAFDRIGHSHISQSLKAKGVSKNLHELIMSLLTNNTVEISIGNESSNPIQIKCSVPQGAPLSPILFNIAIDFLYEEICDSQFAEQNGYKLSEEYEALCLSGFADDQAVTSESIASAIRTIDLIQILFAKIGLSVNPAKSQAIIIKKGLLVAEELSLSDGSIIRGIKPDQRIKYLGCSFNSELVFDHKSVEDLYKNLQKLSVSSLLKPDQKLNVINQYVFPTLIYPLQAAPINKIPAYVTKGLDIMVRRSVKEIIGIPQRTNDNLFYAPRKMRGLGLLRAEWEMYLQHFSIATKLSKVDDGLFQSISNYSEESEECIRALNVTGNTTKILRAELRKEAFVKWCDLSYQGSGAIHFGQHTASNDFVYNKNSLSSSEWVSAIKLSINYANLNGVPGVPNTSSLCRKCEKENETIAHVSGSCPSNNLLITSRHHIVKDTMAELLQEKGFECFVEVYAIDTDGKSRFSDIIAFDPKSKNAFIIDPTVRYETNDRDQDEKICKEKRDIYEKCIPFYAEKYREKFGERNWSVRGLWFGSRGCIGKSVLEFF